MKQEGLEDIRFMFQIIIIQIWEKIKLSEIYLERT